MDTIITTSLFPIFQSQTFIVTDKVRIIGTKHDHGRMTFVMQTHKILYYTIKKHILQP